MSTTRKTKKTAPVPKKRVLPASLVNNASRAAKARKKRLEAQGRVHIESIRRRIATIAEAFYDIGESLRFLKKPDVYRALGHDTFAALVEAEIGISPSHASRLVTIVERIPRDEAMNMGQTKAIALIGLADATPELDSPASILRGKKIDVPGERALDVSEATPREISAAAKKIRATKKATAPKSRGLHASAEDHAFADSLQERLREQGASRAVVTAVAMHSGSADLRIEHIGIDEVPCLKRALRK